jgi:ribonucleoside-diphosphate reductase alpha chain
MKIKSIKKREEKLFTVDIEVEDTHTYQLSNGAVSHNTVSLLNNTASGLHTRFSKYYIRRVRVSRTDPLCTMLIDQGLPWNPENGETIDNYQTAVFDFPIKSPDNAICNSHVDAIEMLEYWKMLKVHWCHHNPSATIFVKDDEWIKVGNWVYENWNKIGGLTFLPKENNMYNLAPYEEISVTKYEELIKTMPVIDFSKLSSYELEDFTIGSQELACSGGACEIR